MTPPQPPCSDSITTGVHPVLVLEGMPGAGKTTAAAALAAENRAVIGEYTTTGAIMPIQEHPDVDDDAGHQRNWLRKHHQVRAARHHGPVFCDRDWLSALAYAYSIADTDHGELLHSRAHWACHCLDRGDLALGSVYIVFQVDPAISLQRRANRRTPRHPWSALPGLIRLATFYADPAHVLAPVHPQLAARLRSASWRPLRGHSMGDTLRILRDLADHP